MVVCPANKKRILTGEKREAKINEKVDLKEFAMEIPFESLLGFECNEAQREKIVSLNSLRNKWKDLN